MSYDLRIYTIKKQEFIGIRSLANVIINEEGFIIPFNNRQIVITKETPIEDEDIPTQISKELPGIKYLIECGLEPITNKEKHIKELIKVAKIMGKEGIGVIENPQTDEIFLPQGVKRVLQIEKTQRFSTIELSWWWNGIPRKLKKNFSEILSRDVKIQRKLLQPKVKREPGHGGFTGLYPKLWPFSGPKVKR